MTNITVPPSTVNVPCVEDTDPTCNWVGRLSVTTTFAADAFPSLVTVSVNVTVSPGIARVLSADFATTGSATSIDGVALGDPLPGVDVAVPVPVAVGVGVLVLVTWFVGVLVDVDVGVAVDVVVALLVGVLVGV